eukprot:TRINITY_DN9739_c0_g1_i1.p1 TRINITY_DN9739_c0_g1~~TRINITY_DN9739_c0_g1_i1.p1  ORF type:complete len:137 (+),score=40.08 TRINITY_DN9739_c0_g1_i1:47-412(+)
MVKRRKADKKKEDGGSVSPTPTTGEREYTKEELAAWEKYYRDYAAWQQQVAQAELQELELDAGPLELVNKIIEKAKKAKERDAAWDEVRKQKAAINTKRTDGETKPKKVKRKADDCDDCNS